MPLRAARRPGRRTPLAKRCHGRSGRGGSSSAKSVAASGWARYSYAPAGRLREAGPGSNDSEEYSHATARELSRFAGWQILESAILLGQVVEYDRYDR